MGLVAPKVKSNIPPIEPKTYQAVCYGIVDLGTHYSEKYKKESSQIAILWELPRCRVTTEHDSYSRVINGIYTFSYAPKSNLRKILDSWRGKVMTKEEENTFDLFTMLGKSCLLQVVNKEGSDGKIYSNIGNITSLMDGMDELKAERPFIEYAMADNGWDVPATVPDWLIEKIKKSKEFINYQPTVTEPEAEPEEDIPL